MVRFRQDVQKAAPVCWNGQSNEGEHIGHQLLRIIPNSTREGTLCGISQDALLYEIHTGKDC